MDSAEGSEVRGALSDKFTALKSSDEDEYDEPLPYVLTEKIVAAIPFPHVYGIRLLSKKMHANFQTLISRNSNRWPTYCPAFLFNQKLVGFDKSNKVWRTFTYRPLVDTGIQFPPPTVEGATVGGALMCMFERSRQGRVVTVTNLLTRKQKTLPLLPGYDDDSNWNWCRPIIVPLGKEHYKVILYGIVCRMEDGPHLGDYLETRVYDSSSTEGGWTPQSTAVTFASCSRYNVYLNASLYFMWPWNERSFSFFYYTGNPCLIDIFRFNFEDGTFTKAASIETRYELILESYLMLCGSRILVVVIDRAPENRAIVSIYELCEKTLGLEKLSSWSLPRENESRGYWISSIDLVGDDGCLYVCDKYSLTTYHIRSNTWSTFDPLPEAYPFRSMPRATINFIPGVNPFAIP